MAVQFMRRKPDPGRTTGYNASLAAQLQGFGDARLTGAVHLTDRRTDHTAIVYLYEGGVYSAELDGYLVPIAARLAAAGLLDQARRRAIAEVDSERSAAGARAVAEGWVDVEVLGGMHQEFLLASLGAIVTLDRVKATVKRGAVTDVACCVPLPMRLALESTRLRRERLDADGQALCQSLGGRWVDGIPSVILARSVAALPEGMRLPEFAAFAALCDGQRTLDEVAWLVGFTRAEAVHVARILAADGVLIRASAVAGPAGDVGERLLVPEQFPGQFRGHPRIEPEPIEPVSVEPVSVEPVSIVPVPVEQDVDASQDEDLDALRAELDSAEREVARLRERLAAAERNRR